MTIKCKDSNFAPYFFFFMRGSISVLSFNAIYVENQNHNIWFICKYDIHKTGNKVTVLLYVDLNENLLHRMTPFSQLPISMVQRELPGTKVSFLPFTCHCERHKARTAAQNSPWGLPLPRACVTGLRAGCSWLTKGAGKDAGIRLLLKGSCEIN